jgi:hypothetical protein
MQKVSLMCVVYTLACPGDNLHPTPPEEAAVYYKAGNHKPKDTHPAPYSVYDARMHAAGLRV